MFKLKKKKKNDYKIEHVTSHKLFGVILDEQFKMGRANKLYVQIA